ncbi:MAG: hypothetical protein IT290_06340, partial [Deltaproteobacteria bacterium]|nr:hypothetical protein [Deltaproteobacteria bacterium]
SVVKKGALASILKETKGHYPAPLKALESVFFGLKNGIASGLKEERRLCAELVISPECKSLVHVFFVSEESAKLSKPLKEDLASARVAVLGGGVMGAGIAAAMLLSKRKVTVIEPVAQVRDRALEHIRNAANRKRSLSDSERSALLNALVVTDDLNKLADADFVIEAIIEDLNVKREIFAKVEGVVGKDTIIATNTSSLSVNDLASALTDSSRIIGLHFFNPAERMPLVEIVRAKNTSDRAVLRSAALVSGAAKFPVIVEDVAGFLVNRILSPYLTEAAALLAEGYSVSDIDGAAMRFGMPMGPLRLLDEIGLDIAAKVSSIMVGRYGDRMRGPSYAETLAALGHLGRKNGSGFYNHTSEESVVDPQIRVKLGITAAEKVVTPGSAEITDRLMLAMVNEGIRCLDEGVAGYPGKEAAAQIDLATVMGMGFPPFRGGLIFYAQSLGAKATAQRMDSLVKRAGPRFEASEGIRKRAEQGKSFFDSIGTLKPSGAA